MQNERRWPENFDLSILTASETAARKSIDNTPSEEQKANLYRVAWFLREVEKRVSIKLDRSVRVIVTSGYRCEKLNKMIGGARKSDHMDGLAADIVVPGMSSIELAKLIAKEMVGQGYDKVIDEFGRWVHVSIARDPGMPLLKTMTAVKRTTPTGIKKTAYRLGFGHAYKETW